CRLHDSHGRDARATSRRSAGLRPGDIRGAPPQMPDRRPALLASRGVIEGVPECAHRARLDTPTIAEVAPLPARHERGEGWGEGLVPSNCRALLISPLPYPTSPPWGRGNRPRAWWRYGDAPICQDTNDSSISRKERGQPCPRVSIISPKYRADKAVRAAS